MLRLGLPTSKAHYSRTRRIQSDCGRGFDSHRLHHFKGQGQAIRRPGVTCWKTKNDEGSAYCRAAPHRALSAFRARTERGSSGHNEIACNTQAPWESARPWLSEPSQARHSPPLPLRWGFGIGSHGCRFVGGIDDPAGATLQPHPLVRGGPDRALTRTLSDTAGPSRCRVAGSPADTSSPWSSWAPPDTSTLSHTGGPSFGWGFVLLAEL